MGYKLENYHPDIRYEDTIETDKNFTVAGTTTLATNLTGALRADFGVISVGAGADETGAADIVVAPTGGDYTTIQGALDAVVSTGGTVYVAAGTYTITTGLLIKVSRTNLIVSHGAIIQCDGAVVTTLIKPNTTSLYGIRVTGGVWLNTNASAAGVCFDFSDAADCDISPLRITGSNGSNTNGFTTALKLSDTANNTFYNHYHDIQIFNCVNGIELSGTQVNNNNFTSIRIRPLAGGAGKGIAITDARGNLFTGINVEPAPGTGITGLHLISSSSSLRARDNTFIGCWFEESATNLLIDVDCVHNTFIGTTFAGTGGSGITDNSTAASNLFINCNADSGSVVFNWHGTITDRNRKELITFGETASAVNQVKVTNAISGGLPKVSAEGDDTNVPLLLTGQGTGKVTIGDGADPTKIVRIETVSATTGTRTQLDFAQTANRTITFPDVTDTVATTSTLDNKYYITKTGSTYQGINLATVFLSSSSSLDTVWTAVLAAISTNPAVIEFGPGTFTTVAGLYLSSSNIKVRGQGKGVTIITADSSTGCDTVGVFEADPSQSATPYDLTVNATVGDLTLTMSSANLTASGIVADDYIIMYSSLGIDSEFDGRNQGELHKVISVNAGTGVITIGATNDGTHVYQTMLTANTTRVAKLTMYKNISFEGITFTDAAASRPSTHPGVLFCRFVDNLSVIDCEVKDGYNTGFLAGQCMNVRAVNSHFKDMKDVTPTANVFYGVAAKGATINMSVSNCTFENMRHGFVQGAGNATYFAGTSRNISVSNCTSINSFTSHFDCHQGCEGLSFVNNVMIGDDGAANGIQSRSPAVITGNSVIGVLGRGISLFGEASSSTISGNDLKGCTTGIYIDKGINEVNITGNTIRKGGVGIRLARSTSAGVTITNASPAVITATAHAYSAGTQVRFTTTGTLPTGLSLLTTYYISATGITANTFQVSATDGGASVNTSSAGSGTHTLSYTSGNNSVITGNNIMENTGEGILANGQTTVKVSGNFFRANTVPISIVDTDSKCADWMITDNYSVAHTTSNLPTILGTGHQIRNNVGFNSVMRQYRAITALRTLDISDHIIDCTSETYTVTLPTAVNCIGREYIIKNSGTGVITVDGNASETIDGLTTFILGTRYDSLTIVSDGANWIIN